MATSKRNRGVRRDDFVKNVRPDPKSTEALILLQGYVGDSNLDGHIRIYFDPRLSDFIELLEQDILHHIPLETTESPLGGSRLWVKKTTVFTAGNPSHVNRIKSSFLEGDLIKAFGNEGLKVPRAIANVGDIPSDFVVTGCGPVTLQFEDCSPTGANDPLCNVLDPTDFTTNQPSRFNATCPQNPCWPTRPLGCITGHPFEVCLSANINCEVVLANRAPVHQPQPGGQAYTGRFNPYGH